MSRKLRMLILVVSFTFLAWFVSQPLTKIGFDKPYLAAPEAGQKIDAAEMSSFLNLWSRMLQGPLKDYVGQISLASGNSYPSALVNWLDAQNWNTERFFYNEQRIHELVDYVNLRANLKSNIELSQRSGANLNEIIKDQKRRLAACPFDDDELALVEANLYQITEIFAGRAVLAKPDN